MKMINKIIMQSEFNTNMLKTGVFYDATPAEAEVEDGALVSIKEPVDHDLYTGVLDLNARKITAYDAAAPIYGVVDYVGVAQPDVMGVTYRVGEKVFGLAPAAGERTRVRMLAVGDEFYLGNENFSGSPAKGAFAVAEDGKTTWKVETSAPATGMYIAIEDTKNLITGQVNEGSIMYRCRVMAL